MGLFNANVFNGRVFNTGGVVPPPVVVVPDGGTGYYTRYRKQLEKSARAAEKFQQSKYIKEPIVKKPVIKELLVDVPIAQAAEIIEQVPVAKLVTKQIKPDINIAQINFKPAQSLIDSRVEQIRLQQQEEDLILMVIL